MTRKRHLSAHDAPGGAEGQIPIEQCLLVQNEIWSVVSEAARNNARLATRREARRIEKRFPHLGLSLSNIADALVYAAVDAGVAVEMRPPPPAIIVERRPRFSFAALRGASGVSA